MLQYCFWFMFWFSDPKACGILAPQSGIEPAPSALGGEVLTTGSPGKSLFYSTTLDTPGSKGKESACNAGASGDAGLSPRSGRSPGEQNGYPLQYSCLENSTGSQRVGHNWATNTNTHHLKYCSFYSPLEYRLHECRGSGHLCPG